MGSDTLLDGLAEVHPQIEAICDLLGSRCPGGGAFGIRPGTVTAHDLDAGVRAQPPGERPGLLGGVGSTSTTRCVSPQVSTVT
ncbi:hypothetical protein ACIBCO_35600 [Streptomyces violascens]|uniref:hypothetical protein n=1 Tax=Streptomyces violascens TaxID=67381 RepID=UPI0037B69728